MSVTNIVPKNWIFFCLSCNNSRNYCYCDNPRYGSVGETLVFMGMKIVMAPDEVLDPIWRSKNEHWLRVIADLMVSLTGDFDWHYHPEKYNKIFPLLPKEFLEKNKEKPIGSK